MQQQHHHKKILNQLNLLQDHIDAGNWTAEAQNVVKRILKISNQPKNNMLRANQLLVNGQRALLLTAPPRKNGPFNGGGAKIDITDQLIHLKFIGGRTKKKRKIGEPPDDDDDDDDDAGTSRSQIDKKKDKKKLMRSMGYARVAIHLNPYNKNIRDTFRNIMVKQTKPQRDFDTITNEDLDREVSKANFTSFEEFVRVLDFSTQFRIPSPPPKINLAQARIDAEKNSKEKQVAYDTLDQASADNAALDIAWDEVVKARRVLAQAKNTFTQQEIYTKATSQLSILNSNLIIIQNNLNRKPASYTRDMAELKTLEHLYFTENMAELEALEHVPGGVPPKKTPRYDELLKLYDTVQKLENMKSETKQKILDLTAMQRTALDSMPTATALAAHPSVKKIHDQYMRAYYTILYFLPNITKTVLTKKMRGNPLYYTSFFTWILKFIRESPEKITYYLPEFIKAYAMYMVMLSITRPRDSTVKYMDNLYAFITNPRITDNRQTNRYMNINQIKYSMQLLGNGFAVEMTPGGEKQIKQGLIDKLTRQFTHFSDRDVIKKYVEEIQESGMTKTVWIVKRVDKLMYTYDSVTAYPNSNLVAIYYNVVMMIRFRNLPIKDIENYILLYRRSLSENQRTKNTRDIKAMMTMIEKVVVQLEEAVRFPLENGFAEYVIAPFWATWNWRHKWWEPYQQMTPAEKKKHNKKKIWDMLDDSAHLRTRKRRMHFWQIATHLVRIASGKWSTDAMYTGWNRDKPPTIPEKARLTAYELAIAALVAMHLEDVAYLMLNHTQPSRISVIGPYPEHLLSEYNSLILQPLEAWEQHPMMFDDDN